jgi:hypothetical protein
VLDQACILALDPSASDAIFIKGNPTLNELNCSVVADSNSPDAVHLQGSATINADTLVTAGGVTTTGNPSFNLNKPAQTYAPVVPDPYASTLTHAFLTTGMPAICTPPPTPVGGVTTYSANSRICGGLTIKNQTVNLSPGTYWVTDGDLALQTNGVLECTACNPATGAGITIIFTIVTGTTVGTFTGNSNSVVGNPPTAPNFNAPNSGPFKGVLFVQDSNGLPAGTTWNSGTFQGGPNAVINGLVYAPKENLTFNGNPAAGGTGCLILVADTLTLSGDSQLNSTGCSAAGVSPPTVKTVALAE